MNHRILPAFALLLALGACIPGGTYELAQVDLTLTARSQQTIVTAVVDKRPYVLSGEESRSFLGTERGNWGGEKKMKTGSGRDLSDEVNDALVRALVNRGIAASPLQPVKDVPATDALSAFRTQGADRLLVVELQDWRTDVYTRVKLSWWLEAVVFDRSGNILGRTSSQGANPVASTSVKGEYTAVAIDELSSKLSSLLNERVITDALR